MTQKNGNHTSYITPHAHIHEYSSTDWYFIVESVKCSENVQKLFRKHYRNTIIYGLKLWPGHSCSYIYIFYSNFTLRLLRNVETNNYYTKTSAHYIRFSYEFSSKSYMYQWWILMALVMHASQSLYSMKLIEYGSWLPFCLPVRFDMEKESGNLYGDLSVTNY